MADLREVLDRHGIDISSLKVLYGEGKDTIYTLSTHGSAAIELWRSLRGLVEETGYWPVVVGDDEALGLHLRAVKQYEYKQIPEIIEASTKIDAAASLREDFETMYDEDDEDEDPYPHGDWPTDIKPDTLFSTPYREGWLPFEERTFLPTVYLVLVPTYLVLVPTRISWHVPAYFKVGGWNYCPEPEEQCAVFRYWEERYGAEFVCMQHDTFELEVARPPTTREDAIALAEEQYGYCPDIVDQGVATLEALAATLLNGRIWFFWWD